MIHLVINHIKRSLWDTILKVVIAVASAVLGIVGGNAMSL